MELTVEQKIQRESLAVMTHHKYRSLGGVIMMGVTRVEDDAAKCPTAYTDGLNTVYGRAFMGVCPRRGHGSLSCTRRCTRRCGI